MVADGKVCTLGVGGILSCFDASSGALLWRKQSTDDFLGIHTRPNPPCPPSSRMASASCMSALPPTAPSSLSTSPAAQPKWKWDGDGPANSSPVIMTVAGRKQLVIFTSKYLVGLDLADGKLLWQVSYQANQGVNATPVVSGNTVFFTGQGKGLAAMKIEQQGGSFTATPLWSTPKFPARYTSPILKDGFLYGSYNGHLFCANAQTGEEVWDQDAKLGDTATLVDASPVIFALGARGQLLAFKPEPTFTQLARYTVAATETWAHPVIAGNRIFVKDNETVSLWGLE